MKRWLPRIAVVAVVAAAASYLWIAKPWAKDTPGITFSTVPVGRGSIAAQVTANGTLSARSTVLVGAQVSGRVLEINADFNSVVKKGQIIAKLDDSVLRAQLEQSQASYDLAVANQSKAGVAVLDGERQYNRQKALQAQELVAGAVVESAETVWQSAKASLSAARASVNQATANLKQARTNLAYATIYSPVDGTVLSRSVDVGQTVAATLQAPTLFTIAEDLARMQIDTAVAEADVGRLTDGIKVAFTVDAFPGKIFDGVVRQVRNAPVTQSGVVTYDAVIDVDNKGKGLRPGMTANVTFVLDQVADTVKIPNAALRFKPTREQLQAVFAQYGGGRGSGMRGSGGPSSGSGGGPPGGPPGPDGARADKEPPDRKVVWKLVDGKPKRISIKVGLSDGSSTQVVDGELAAGDQLITEIQGVTAAPRKMGAF